MNLDLLLYEELVKILADLHEQLILELGGGKAQSFDDYRYRVGRLKGISDALNAAKEAQRKVLGLDDKNR
jgi:hypothetical protein